jgi:hypothetical protein
MKQGRKAVAAAAALPSVRLPDGMAATLKTDMNLLTVDYVSTSGKDVEWKVFF